MAAKKCSKCGKAMTAAGKCKGCGKSMSKCTC